MWYQSIEYVTSFPGYAQCNHPRYPLLNINVHHSFKVDRLDPHVDAILMEYWLLCKYWHPWQETHIGYIMHSFGQGKFTSEMISVLGQDSILQGYTGPGTTWANGMNFSMNHAPGAALIAWLVDLQSSALPLWYSCPPYW